MLRAIGRALRRLIAEAIEGSTGFGAPSVQMLGRLVYSWFRGDREISDAVALLVAVSTLAVALLFLLLVSATIFGVASWLRGLASRTAGHDDSPEPNPPEPDERHWWE